MGYKGKRIALISGGIVGGMVIAAILQMLLPFPAGFFYGNISWAIIGSICIVIAFVVIKPEKPEYGSQSPLSILKERYARGEITKEEYEKMKNDLK